MPEPLFSNGLDTSPGLAPGLVRTATPVDQRH
jgi:hypothetical protein